jgi:hypothetical protein
MSKQNTNLTPRKNRRGIDNYIYPKKVKNNIEQLFTYKQVRGDFSPLSINERNFAKYFAEPFNREES